VDEEVEAPTSVTLMTFDGPLSDGAHSIWQTVSDDAWSSLESASSCSC